MRLFAVAWPIPGEQGRKKRNCIRVPWLRLDTCRGCFDSLSSDRCLTKRSSSILNHLLWSRLEAVFGRRRASFYGVEEDKVLETAENELMKRDGFQ